MNIELIRGRSLTLSGTVLQDDEAFSITGATLTFTAKRNIKDLDSAAVFQKTTTANTITVVSAAKGTFRVAIDPDDTADEKADKLVWDLTIRTAGDSVFTLSSGIITLSSPVTQNP